MIGWDPMKPDQDTAGQNGNLIAKSDTRIADFLDQTCRLVRRLDRAAIARAQDLLLECHRRGGRVFTAGNGGSSSTAQHFACDLAKFAAPPGQRPSTHAASRTISAFMLIHLMQAEKKCARKSHLGGARSP